MSGDCYGLLGYCISSPLILMASVANFKLLFKIQFLGFKLGKLLFDLCNACFHGVNLLLERLGGAGSSVRGKAVVLLLLGVEALPLSVKLSLEERVWFQEGRPWWKRKKSEE